MDAICAKFINPKRVIVCALVLVIVNEAQTP